MQVRAPRRGRLLATCVGLLTLMATMMASPVSAQSAACAIDYSVQHQWPGGFTASVTISNGGSAINGWTLDWQFPNGQQIQQAWNSSVNDAGPGASVSNASWNATIPSGGSVNFGFNGSWNNTTNGTPSSFTLNGATCGEDPGPDPDPDPDPDPSGTLREAADAAGIEIGMAVAAGPLSNDQTYRQVLAREFSSVTAENAMKFDAVQPQRGQFDFSQGDALVDFAQANGQVVRGHTLIWHSQNPGWLTNGNFSAAELRQIMETHITEVMTHYRGELQHWDVANEIFNEDGTWRDTIWYRAMGPEYVEIALRTARAADPTVDLYLNDYNIDGLGAKSDAYYNLAQQLLAEGVPLDGIGLQGHLQTTWFPSGVQQNIQRFANLGLDVAFTEVDIRMPLPVDDAKLATQADHFARTVDACLAESRCVSYTVWGLTDAHSWVPDVFDGEGAATLFTSSYQPKPAYDAVLEALQSAG